MLCVRAAHHRSGEVELDVEVQVVPKLVHREKRVWLLGVAHVRKVNALPCSAAVARHDGQVADVGTFDDFVRKARHCVVTRAHVDQVGEAAVEVEGAPAVEDEPVASSVVAMFLYGLRPKGASSGGSGTAGGGGGSTLAWCAANDERSARDRCPALSRQAKAESRQAT